MALLPNRADRPRCFVQLLLPVAWKSQNWPQASPHSLRVCSEQPMSLILRPKLAPGYLLLQYQCYFTVLAGERKVFKSPQQRIKERKVSPWLETFRSTTQNAACVFAVAAMFCSRSFGNSLATSRATANYLRFFLLAVFFLAVFFLAAFFLFFAITHHLPS